MGDRILVVGSVNMDLVMRIPQMPEAGQTLLGSEYAYIPGGKGANQAVACARLGGQVGLAACVGRDAFGRLLLDGFAKDCIDTSYVKQVDAPTGLAVIPVEANGGNRIVVFPGANAELTIEDVEYALSFGWDAVILQLEIPLETVYATIRMSHKRGITTILDAGPALGLDLSRLDGLDILSPNENEAAELSGLPLDTYEQAEQAAKYLHERSHAQSLVIKLGERGSLLYENGVCTVFPAFSGITAVDTTAAGDSYTAALTLRRICGSSWEEAIRYANAVGAICVTRRGAQPSLPYADEVEAFLASR